MAKLAYSTTEMDWNAPGQLTAFFDVAEPAPKALFGNVNVPCVPVMTEAMALGDPDMELVAGEIDGLLTAGLRRKAAGLALPPLEDELRD